MNTIFSYSANAKYSAKDLKGGYNNINFSLLDIYLDEKGPSVKIQLLNVFKDHHIMAKPSTISVGYDEWSLSNALWMKFSHGKYKPELNEYFHMYRCQLNFALFCATSALGISYQHLNHPNLLVRAVYRFHLYFHVRSILHNLGTPLPYEDGFSKVKNSYINSAYYAICYDCGVDADETWMHGDWFYTTSYAIFTTRSKATKRSPPDDVGRWIITWSRGLTRKGIEKISRSVRAYVYLVLTSQVQARSSIVGNSASAVDAQEVFKSTFKALIDEDYSISNNIQRYQDVLEHALSKVDFSVGIGIYMLPSNLNLKIGSTKGYNNKILISSAGMKIGLNIETNKEAGDVKHDASDKQPVKEHPIAQDDNSRMLAKKHDDEKLAIALLIVGTGLIAYHFW